MIRKVHRLSCAPIPLDGRLQGALHRRLEHGRIVGLTEVAVGTEAKSPLPRFGARVSSHYQNREIRANLLDPFQHAEPILIRKANVQKDQVCDTESDLSDATRSCGRFAHSEPPSTEKRRHGPSDEPIVVDDQNRRQRRASDPYGYSLREQSICHKTGIRHGYSEQTKWRPVSGMRPRRLNFKFEREFA